MVNVTLCRTKDVERKKLEQQVTEWLKKGNKINQIESSLSAQIFVDMEFNKREPER